MFCPKCGRKVADNAVVCDQCGFRFDTLIAQVQPPAHGPVQPQQPVAAPAQQIAAPAQNKGGGKKIGVIIGCVLGGILLLAVLFLAIFAIVRKDEPEKPVTETSQTTPTESGTLKEKIVGNRYVIVGLTVNSEGDYYEIAFDKDGTAEFYALFYGTDKKSTEASYSYDSQTNKVSVTFELEEKTYQFTVDELGYTRYFRYALKEIYPSVLDKSKEATFEQVHLLVPAVDYETSGSDSLVKQLDGKSFRCPFFNDLFEYAENTAYISFTADSEHSGWMSGEFHPYEGGRSIDIFCHAFNDNLMYCELFINVSQSDGTRYEFFVEKTKEGYQGIIIDTKGTFIESWQEY